MWTEGISSSQVKLIIWNGWKTEGGARLKRMKGKDAVDFAGRADVNNGELVPSARFNYTTLPKQEYRRLAVPVGSCTLPAMRTTFPVK